MYVSTEMGFVVLSFGTAFDHFPFSHLFRFHFFLLFFLTDDDANRRWMLFKGMSKRNQSPGVDDLLSKHNEGFIPQSLVREKQHETAANTYLYPFHLLF